MRGETYEVGNSALRELTCRLAADEEGLFGVLDELWCTLVEGTLGASVLWFSKEYMLARL